MYNGEDVIRLYYIETECYVTQATRADRQTLMFSATWPAEVRRLAFEYLSRPARVVIGSKDLSASHSVTQARLVMVVYQILARGQSFVLSAIL